MSDAHPARWFEGPDARGKILCTLCPRACKLGPGQQGFCFVRRNEGGRLVTIGYGATTGFAVDPIEKKPLFHFYPGSTILSFGTAGCNLGCRFCQNWTSSKARSESLHRAQASPDEVVALAFANGAPSIAFTYNDPVIFAEYAIDVAQVARARGVKTVAVTAGYISAGAREAFFAPLDAANVDLKSMDESFYKKMCAARLGPVLETLEYLARETQVWVELTNLVIPGLNDSDDQIARLAAWVVEHMGVDVPVHFSAFHPDYRLTDAPRTPAATLQRAARLAREHGLRHVYTGNVHDPRGQSTHCPQCDALLVGRSGYRIERLALVAGACPECGTALAGRFGAG